MVTIENLWDELISHQGEIFYTAKGLPFTYTIKGGEFFSDRKRKSITRATFERSFIKIQEDKENKITGPKSLNVFGAPYIYATFRQLGVVPKPTSRPKAGGHKKV